MIDVARPVLLVAGPPSLADVLDEGAADVLTDLAYPQRFLVDGLDPEAAARRKRILVGHSAVEAVALAWSVAVGTDPSLDDVRCRLHPLASHVVRIHDPDLGTLEHLLFPSAASAANAIADASCGP